MHAKLALADGTVFTGRGFGATGETLGEVVFNTSMTGYQEVLTDPSYTGQIVTMTYPLIGNYGTTPDDQESRGVQVAGFIVRELTRVPSNFRSNNSLDDFLKASNVVGIEGIDTRALVRRLRVRGAMNGVLSTADLDDASLVAKARAFPGMEGRERSPGDENTFRLLPLALTAVYRFTWLDDNWGIPVVPYLRGGLSYYVWWFRTNGETSSACWDGTQDPGCDKDKAIGATIGVQGSIGVAIRAERIDPDAATSMRASGIQHAGFYAELSLARVDGFGRDEKLSVGDATWFAGVDFEF